MPIAQPRYLFSDLCAHDSATCFMVIPVGEGENVLSLSGTIQAMTIPGASQSEYLSPFAFLEHNIIGMFVPFDVALTLLPSQQTFNPVTKTLEAGGLGGFEQTPRGATDKSDWDRLFRTLVFEMGVDGDQFYGAETDGTQSNHTYDPISNVWLRRPAGAITTPTAHVDTDGVPPPAGTAQDSVALEGAQTEPFSHISDLPTYGPRGVRRLFSDERMLSTDNVTNFAKSGIALLDNLLGAVGLNDMAYRDSIHVRELFPSLPGPGFILVGAIRFQVDVPTRGFSVDSNAPSTDAAQGTADYVSRADVLNAYMTGNHQFIEAALQFNTSFRGDLARSMVFGGDNNILDVSLAGSVMQQIFASGESFIRANPIVYAGKLHLVKGTPYHLSPV